MDQQISYYNSLSRIAQARVLQRGIKGQVWLSNLDQLVKTLCNKWKLRPGQILGGSTESLIIEAYSENDGLLVLKIALPGNNIQSESAVLKLANGRGYIQIYDVDFSRGALLLEHAGVALSNKLRPIDEHISVLCSVLEKAWIRPDLTISLPNAIYKALEMETIIRKKWKSLNNPFSQQTFDLALEYVQARIDAFKLDDAVIVHGDAHGFNILETKDGTFKLIDPEGIIADKGLDLICIMRDWNKELLNGNTFELLRARCLNLSKLTNSDETSIWQWGYLSRLVIGLILLEFGQINESKYALQVADRVSHFRFF